MSSPDEVHPSTTPDPRVFFASERTLLAWLRTGLAVVGLGFIVARFGVFMAMAGAVSGTSSNSLLSGAIGTGFVFLGAAIMLVSARQHARFVQTMSADQRPVGYSTQMGTVSAVLIALLAAALGLYLTYSLLV
jgi:putative membrane protein